MLKLNMNLVLLRSIPIDKDLKRYYLSKYKHLVKHNGLVYANSIFKDLEASLKRYISSKRLPSIPIRSNGWFKKLIHYCDSQPHYALNFIHGIHSWVGAPDPLNSSRKFHNFLRDQREEPIVEYYRKEKFESLKLSDPGFWHYIDAPPLLGEWYYILSRSHKERSKIYNGIRNDRLSSHFSKFVSIHDFHEWHNYWNKMWSIFVRPKTVNNAEYLPVFPEMYKDYSYWSRSYEIDYKRVLSAMTWNKDITWASKEACIVPALGEDWLDHVPSVISPGLGLLDSPGEGDEDGQAVGEIHYIVKDGTDFRPIAVPNRFIQGGLNPIMKRLQAICKDIPVDATFNQVKFDSVITSRVSTTSRFCGSVDISKATENIPLRWIYPFINMLNLNCSEIHSWNLFTEVSRGLWINGKFYSRWERGQPLGTLPSFSVLSLTHNFILESLSLQAGYSHSPYRVLGDDSIIFSKRLYRSYIKFMDKEKIPVSLHKSYYGRLSEFAGKVFIKNNLPFHVPDHHMLTYQSLFDYQRVTGIRIPWNHLPKKMRNKISQLAGDMSGAYLYKLAQVCEVYDRGSSTSNYSNSEKELLIKYFQSQDYEEKPHTYDLHTGITKVRDLIVKLNPEPREIHGMYRRYNSYQLPKWYREKFRPVSTDTVLQTVCKVVREDEAFTR